jgi:hypothetical protein
VTGAGEARARGSSTVAEASMSQVRMANEGMLRGAGGYCGETFDLWMIF